MINKSDVVESQLKLMFYYRNEYEKKVQDIGGIMHEMVGLKSPNLTDIHGTPEDRQHKLIRLGEKLSELEKEKNTYDVNYKDIYNKYRLYDMDQQDFTFIEYLYKHKLTGDKVANKLHYTSKMYVSRKKKTILDKLAIYV